MTVPPAQLPTLPNFGGAGERRALLAGITFLDVTDTATPDLATLADWFEEHVVAGGTMPRLSILLEPAAVSVALRPTGHAVARANADLPRLVALARARVVHALQGLIAAPSDDHFLRAAIFLGRVFRSEGRWVARPEATAPLSGIVLSLFAVAILSDRAFYDRELCVCDTCGRIGFDHTPAMRHTCPTHATRVSGVSEKFSLRGRAVG